MGKVKQVFVDLEHEGPDQEEDAREASSLVSFVAISLCIAVLAGWAGILSGSI